MTSNAEIAKAMADNMTHAAVPLYGKSCGCRTGVPSSASSRSFGGCCSRHISVTRS